MFGLIGHLTSLSHAKAVAKRLGYDEYADQGLEFWCSAPPQTVDEIKVVSATGQVIRGVYVESCFLPEMLAGNRIKTAIRKVLNAMAHAQKQGIHITALGGFSSIIFENFNLGQIPQVRNIQLDIKRFTTGNTHTAYIICRQLVEASKKFGIDLQRAIVTVCGASGDIGSAVCRWLTAYTPLKELLLVARNQERLQEIQQELKQGKVTSIEAALPQSDIVVWVASMPKGMEIDVNQLKRPCLLIDGGYPKNMANQISAEGVYVLNGGIVEHCLDIDWKIMDIVNMALPARHLFACFAESMLLEFEGWYTNFSWGRNQITPAKMEQIGAISRKHGFTPLID
ncbi:MAG: long-chain acyl-[acyl-carrier-protein] reductase [Pseudanabaenaceae cyanobacterium]